MVTPVCHFASPCGCPVVQDLSGAALDQVRELLRPDVTFIARMEHLGGLSIQGPGFPNAVERNWNLCRFGGEHPHQSRDEEQSRQGKYYSECDFRHQLAVGH